MEMRTTWRWLPLHADLFFDSIQSVSGHTAPCAPAPRNFYCQAHGSMPEECTTWPTPPHYFDSIQSVVRHTAGVSGPAAPRSLPTCDINRVSIQSVAGPTAVHPPPTARNLYRGSIQSVGGPGRRISPSPFSQSGHTRSSYSSDSDALSSNMSNSSGCSSGSGSAGTADFFDDSDLLKIARQMVIDGYTQRTVQEFDLENWFFEIDVDWVLQIRSSSSKTSRSKSWCRVGTELWS